MNKENSKIPYDDMQKKLECLLTHIPYEIHAIYNPDGSDFWGDCYCAAVDLFSWEFTFRVYFKLDEEGNVDVQHVERWHFG